MSSVTLSDTSGQDIDVSTRFGLTPLFYPRTGAPGENITDDWNTAPGARGCTPQACSFRDQLAELRKLRVENVSAVSTQDNPHQAEAKARMHLPSELLSDEALQLATTLKLPTFEWQDRILLKRIPRSSMFGTC